MSYQAAERNRARRRRYQRAWGEARRLGIPTGYVPAAEVAGYLAQLHSIGWSNPALEHMTGGVVHRSTFSKLTRENHPQLQRATADGILDIPWTLKPAPIVPDACMVPSLGAKRRIQALMLARWPHHAIKEATGIVPEGIIRGRCRSIRAGAWRAIDEAFDSMAMRLGPEVKSETWARGRGYVPALGWLDIDDPDEVPQLETDRRDHDSYDEAVVLRILAGDFHLPATPAERREVVRRWQGSLADLERQTGWRPDRYVTRDEGAA